MAHVASTRSSKGPFGKPTHGSKDSAVCGTSPLQHWRRKSLGENASGVRLPVGGAESWMEALLSGAASAPGNRAPLCHAAAPTGVPRETRKMGERWASRLEPAGIAAILRSHGFSDIEGINFQEITTKDRRARLGSVRLARTRHRRGRPRRRRTVVGRRVPPRGRLGGLSTSLPRVNSAFFDEAQGISPRVLSIERSLAPRPHDDATCRCFVHVLA